MSQVTDIPRPEHPRPQFMREDWINLNGQWTYTFDHGKSGMEIGRRLNKSTGFDDTIAVPFCPESPLSGVQYTDFIEAMWYHRTIEIPENWKGKRIVLHFGAVDYECEPFIDGVSVGTHFGGTVSFRYDITPFVETGKTHQLVLRVLDEFRDGSTQPAGKQSPAYRPSGARYTRTTGIWQTVWMEATGLGGLRDVHIIPDLDGERFILLPTYYDVTRGLGLRATLKAGDETAAEAAGPVAQNGALVLRLDAARPWSPDDPFLYDLVLDLTDSEGRVLDTVRSYAGLRKVHIEDNQVFLNNEPIYQRLVLDQGFYPEGIWTAPSDGALKQDIELSLKAGFNGARLHQKVFEERFHYWADRLGYLTWGESASWGCNVNKLDAARNFLTEWGEILVRDRNHPSIITWTPFNETGFMTDQKQHYRIHRDSYDLCKTLDPTRPVNDTSGYIHVKTDLWTVHTYQQDPAKLDRQLTPDPDTGVHRNVPEREVDYTGQPYLVDEYGGIKWVPPDRQAYADDSWGYGAPETIEGFYERLEALTDVILRQQHISGYCYTQLTDIEQEQNGIYTYDRSEKFDMARIAAVFRKEPRPSSE